MADVQYWQGDPRGRYFLGRGNKCRGFDRKVPTGIRQASCLRFSRLGRIEFYLQA